MALGAELETGATVVRSRAGAVKSPWNPSFAPRRGCTRWVVQCGQIYAKPTTTRELAPFAVGEVRRCARARAAEQATRLAIIGARFRRSPSHFVPRPGVQADLPILP